MVVPQPFVPDGMASTAGLAGRKAMVWVGPPLLAKPPANRGLVEFREVDWLKPQEVPLSML